MFGVFCGARSPKDRKMEVGKMIDLLSHLPCNPVPYSFTSVVNHGGHKKYSNLPRTSVFRSFGLLISAFNLYIREITDCLL